MDGVLFSFVLLCAFSAGLTHDDHTDHLIDVTVYYESMCPDSIAFVTKQLHPALEKDALAKRVNLTLVPFGKSKYDVTTSTFTCHHGFKECEGNKLHACALKIIQGGRNTDKLGFNSGAFDFINCLMSKVELKGNTTEFPVTQCAVDLQSGVVPEAKINNCKQSNDGNVYLQALGNQTDAFQKPLKSVPTVVFNNTYNEENDKLAKSNFVQALCKYIDHDKPDDCNGASAPAAYIGTIALSLFLLSKNFI